MQFPPGDYPEFAFLGRSNVGKSTLLNCLLKEKNLARTSSKPGCTQVINFFRVDDQIHLVDLPGYGFAKVPRHYKDEWKRLIEAYLLHRETLELCFVLLDARRGWMEMDLVVSNPPYVRMSEKVQMSGNVLKHEPDLALYVADEDPLIYYKKIAELGTEALNEKGMLFFEINENLATITSEILSKSTYQDIEVKKDIYGKNRMIRAFKK